MTDTPIAAWPALDGGCLQGPRIEIGVWGKADGAASDFRWLAVSEGFPHGDLGGDRLARAWSLGLEDRPRPAACWRGKGATRFALGLSSSRAVDAAGRRGFLEKYVIAQGAEPSLPSAAAAARLLPAAAALDDGLWWPRRRQAEWARRDTVLPIDGATVASVAAGLPTLARAVARGLDALAASGMSARILVALYAALLEGQNPACLVGLEAPLPPAALAALLLPLPRERADALSLAGWIPSSRGALHSVGARWNLVVCPPGAAWRPARATTDDPMAGDPLVGDEARARAAAMAKAILAADPAGLAAERSWSAWTAAAQSHLTAATEALIACGLWLPWRRAGRLTTSERPRVALAWLTAAPWSQTRGPQTNGSPIRDPQAVSAAWEYALDDLGVLDPPAVDRLTAGGRAVWPWIPGHEGEQLAALCAMTRNAADADRLRHAGERALGGLGPIDPWERPCSS